MSRASDRPAPSAAPKDGPLQIRRARAEEAAALTELSLRSKAIWGYDPAFLARATRALEVKMENVARELYFVAERQGRLAGFYGFESVEGGIGLDFMFVEPALVGRGIGRALWRHAVAMARADGHRALIVVSDPNAAGFYLRMGARRIGSQPSDLEPGRRLPVLRYDL